MELEADRTVVDLELELARVSDTLPTVRHLAGVAHLDREPGLDPRPHEDLAAQRARRPHRPAEHDSATLAGLEHDARPHATAEWLLALDSDAPGERVRGHLVQPLEHDLPGGHTL